MFVPSAALPLHHSLILASDREYKLVIKAEGNSHDVLRVASYRKWFAAVAARVTEDIYEAEVVSSDNIFAVMGPGYAVNMRAVAPLREDAVHAPAELSVFGRPHGSRGVGFASFVLFGTVFGDYPVEDFVSSTI